MKNVVLLSYIVILLFVGCAAPIVWQCPQNESDYEASNPPDNGQCAYVNGVLVQ